MEVSVEQLQTEIDDILSELNEISETLAKLEPVSHKSKASVVWVGGIPGAIREIKEGKRLENMINAPIYKDKSFYQLAFEIAVYADELSEKQVKIQSLVGKDDARYYEKVDPIVRIVNKTVAVWYQYSPDMADEPITIGNEKNVSLAPSVRKSIKEGLAKMDYPEALQGVKDSLSSKTENSGCFGVILILLMLSTSITAIAATTF